MSDVSVEGSAARAADRGRDQLGLGAIGSKPLLGNSSVILGLVREFSASVFDVRKKYHSDALSAEECIKQVKALSVEYGDIIMGSDDRYQTTDFYSIKVLGSIITKRVPADDSVDDPGELFFTVLAGALLTTAVSLENNTQSESSAKKTIDTLIQESTNFILWGHG